MPGGHRTARWAAAAGLAVTALTGCAASSVHGPVGAPPITSATGPTPLTTPSAVAPVATAPADQTLFVRSEDGVRQPDPTLTPGAVAKGVTRAMVCAQTVPSGQRANYGTRKKVLTDYGIAQVDSHAYFVDTLVPESLGGTQAQKNLWPQPRTGPGGLAQKQSLDAGLTALVCRGSISLATAQHALTHGWWTAYRQYARQIAALPRG